MKCKQPHLGFDLSLQSPISMMTTDIPSVHMYKCLKWSSENYSQCQLSIQPGDHQQMYSTTLVVKFSITMTNPEDEEGQRHSSVIDNNQLKAITEVDLH